ncbi:MAG TPA: FAD-binding oxidoreductase [Mucilaginibacter sp.]|jgi:ferredoxin-NADP reductase|nr:FAD-binding oxidoreductase [Mucilaginibacter sp.]
MEKYTVKVLKTEFVTHNVKRFTLEKPKGYSFISGQATDVSINKPGLEDDLHPFTFTCLNTDDHLEFTIKIYKGMTKKLLDIKPGDELILHEVFGAINYQGPGLFIAGGAGITPFISILRQLKKDIRLAGNVLLFANHTEEDVILKDELDEMLGQNHIDVISNPTAPGAYGSRIDKEMISRYITDKTEYAYICGPDEFVAEMKKDLLELGMKEDQIVIEQ